MYWKCWLSPCNWPNQQIKPHPTKWHYPLITYLTSLQARSFTAGYILGCKRESVLCSPFQPLLRSRPPPPSLAAATPPHCRRIAAAAVSAARTDIKRPQYCTSVTAKKNLFYYLLITYTYGLSGPVTWGLSTQLVEAVEKSKKKKRKRKMGTHPDVDLYLEGTDYGRPMKPFFNDIPNFWAEKLGW